MGVRGRWGRGLGEDQRPVARPPHAVQRLPLLSLSGPTVEEKNTKHVRNRQVVGRIGCHGDVTVLFVFGQFVAADAGFAAHCDAARPSPLSHFKPPAFSCFCFLDQTAEPHRF